MDDPPPAAGMGAWMEYVVAALVMIAIVGFAFLAALAGMGATSTARQRHGPARSLPWWYIGGQPDMTPPDADDTRHSETVEATAKHR